jgi:hypothetical protein
MIYKRIFLFCLVLISALSARSQTASGIQSIIASMDTLRYSMPAEKVYIQFDKPYYVVGDTMRMKAYLFDAAMLKRSDKSGIVYVELANDTNKVLFRRMLPVGFGLGTGNIILNDGVPEGSYTIRAYTNLMKNFGEDQVFKKNFYLSGSSAKNWLVNSQIVFSKQGEKDNVRVGLQFMHITKQFVLLRELDLRIVDGKKVIQRDKVKTDTEGKLDVNFNLPDNAGLNTLKMIVADAAESKNIITIPLPINRDENTDLQFMPEGGNLVAGIPSVVGFKAISEDGNGLNVTGKIYSNNQEVTAFSSTYKGMGSFEFTPKAGEVYTAKIDLNSTTKSFPLPAIQNAGIALRLKDNPESDSVEVIISATSSSSAYYLTAQSRGIVCYGAIIRFNGNNSVAKKIAKNIFPTGIARFTLMAADKQPLNERITFIDHHDNLDIEIKPAKQTFQTRDSIALAIEVKDTEGKPVEGSFSLAVTDDTQVRTDSLSNNMLTSLLLTSDLKGTVEYPGHYFLQTNQAKKDLNNLLLTQGWTGYDWKNVFSPLIPQYEAESEFVISGKISNAFNKGKSNLPVQLLSLKPALTKISISNSDGRFKFTDLPVTDSLKYFIQAKNRNDKSFNIGIEIDKFRPLDFKAPKQNTNPWYVNGDTVLLRQALTRAIQEGKKLNPRGTNLLQEVSINAKKVVKGSKNLNGAGEADQILDNADLENDTKKTLLDVMQEKVRGFNVGIWPTRNVPMVGINIDNRTIMDSSIPPVSGLGGQGFRSKSSLGSSPIWFEKFDSYRIFDKEMHLVIDGVDIDHLYYPSPGYPYPTTSLVVALQRGFNPAGDYILERNAADHDERLRFIKEILMGILAEDVKGIEVMYDPKYNGQYKRQYTTGNTLASLSFAGPDWAYVEVTTYSGNGAFLKAVTGAYLHRPMAYVNTAAFYRPRYAVKKSPLIDYRSTIHWEPDIVTDKNGKANVSFYAADKQGTYSIIMEGSDMKGNIGRQTGRITIK